MSVSAGYSLETLIEDEFGNAIVGAVEYGNGQIIFSGIREYLIKEVEVTIMQQHCETT